MLCFLVRLHRLPEAFTTTHFQQALTGIQPQRWTKEGSLPVSFSFFFFFLGLHLQQMDESELQLPQLQPHQVQATCYLHHSLWQCHILNQLREVRYQTRILMVASLVLNSLSHNRKFPTLFLKCTELAFPEPCSPRSVSFRVGKSKAGLPFPTPSHQFL